MTAFCNNEDLDNLIRSLSAVEAEDFQKGVGTVPSVCHAKFHDNLQHNFFSFFLFKGVGTSHFS